MVFELVYDIQLLGRSLFCLGLLLRYGGELIVKTDSQHVHIDKSLSLLKRYLVMEDFGLKVRALQASENYQRIWCIESFSLELGS